MPERNGGFWRDLLRPGTALCAVFCGVLGVIAAILALTIGFWKTVLIYGCLGIGWFIGFVPDKRAYFRKFLRGLTQRDE